MSQRDPTTDAFAGSGADLPLDQAEALDAACDAFERKWTGGGRPDVLAAVLEVEERLRPAAARELVALDVYYRRRAGEPLPDYAARVPALDPDWLAGIICGAGDATAARPGGADRPPRAGDAVRYFGDFELLGEISRGGMGVVYRARQVSLDRVVALKMIKSGEFARPVEARRFRQEVEAASAFEVAFGTARAGTRAASVPPSSSRMA